MDNTLKSIIEQLSEKTKVGQVNWQKGDNSNEFILYLSEAVISISLYNNFGSAFADCTVSNKRGDIVLRENSLQTMEDGKFLVAFYNLVRDSYTGKEQVVSSIFAQLRSDNQIGDVPQDSDLPF